MHITDALYGEHGTLYLLMNAIERSAASADLASLQTSARLLESAILAHAEVEDDLLFKALDRTMPAGGPVTVMRAEHHEIEAELARVAASRDAAEACLHLDAAFAAARSHFLKEEAVLFPLAEQLIGTPELERMGATWALGRGVSLPAAPVGPAAAAR